MKKIIILFIIVGLYSSIYFARAANPCDKYEFNKRFDIYSYGKAMNEANREISFYFGWKDKRTQNIQEKISWINRSLATIYNSWYGGGGIAKKICSDDKLNKKYSEKIPKFDKKIKDTTQNYLKILEEIAKPDYYKKNINKDKMYDIIYGNLSDVDKQINITAVALIKLKPKKIPFVKDHEIGDNEINKIDYRLSQSQQVSSDSHFNIIGLKTPGRILTTIEKIPIAVKPPDLFGKNPSELTPQNFVDYIKNFLFKISNELFILLIVVGGIFYILGVFKPSNIQTGKNWIFYAILGYAILLIASAIFSLAQLIIGPPQ